MPPPRKAFTLAETLVTLGIIGVVATITIPTLIENYQKKVTINRLKVSYSILNNAIERAKADYGTDFLYWEGSDHSGEAFDFLYNSYFKPYIETVDVKKTQICKVYKCKSEYKTLNGEEMYQHEWSGSFTLKNGALVHIHPYDCGFGNYFDAIYIDVDGPQKGKNTLGIDVFDFMLAVGRKNYQNPDKGFILSPCQNYTREELLEVCNKNYNKSSCSASGTMSCCAELIMQDGWEIKKDYPWK